MWLWIWPLDGQPWCEGPDRSRRGGDKVDKGFPDVDKDNILLIMDVTLDECGLCVRFGAMGFTHSIIASSHNNPVREVLVCPLHRWRK